MAFCPDVLKREGIFYTLEVRRARAFGAALVWVFQFVFLRPLQAVLPSQPADSLPPDVTASVRALTILQDQSSAREAR